MGKGTKILIIILAIIIILAVGIIAYKIISNKDRVIDLGTDSGAGITTEEDNGILEVPIKTVQIYKGDERPIAVMIDNHKSALPQGGISKAYMVYEIIVEGGESRLMALFKGEDLEQIGPVRSARHYFLDYALENDAIYVHFGWSPQAESDISSLNVNNINGISESSTSFWRVKDKSAPHNVATSTTEILKIAEQKEYRTTSTKESVLNYVTEEVELKDGISAEKITIPYSTSNEVEYIYDSEAKVYQRYSRGIKAEDWTTGENITTKNIIITFAKNTTLNDGENKDRQNLSNIGSLDGYYITNGKAIKIKCEKVSRSAQTVYKDLEGNEIQVNDGNTFVQICPINAKVEIEGAEQTENTDNTID
ncbi:MAG: DUF3048 domain-containing protein [Clostridia bacterium]